MSITVKNLSYSYGKHQVLHDINFHISDGELVNVLGPNGVGKSTLFKCILGLQRDYQGEIFIDGKDIRDMSVKKRAKHVSYIPQNHAPVYDYDVIDVVLMSTGVDLGMLRSPGKREMERAHSALERVGIEHLAHRIYTQISGGEQQLVLIARALAQDARTIIMDEPTSALDYGNTIRVLSQVSDLAQEGYSIIQSTHQPDQAFLFADKTLIINHGSVYAFGEPKETITSASISDLYNIDVEVHSLNDDSLRVCVPVRTHSAGTSTIKK